MIEHHAADARRIVGIPAQDAVCKAFLVIRAHRFAEIALQSVVHRFVARDEEGRKHGFQPLHADDREPPVLFDEFVGNGEIHGMQGVLLEETPAHIPRRAVEGLMQVVVLDDEHVSLRTGIGERIRALVRPVSFRIARICINGVDGVFVRERFARFQQFHAADMVSAFRRVERFQHLFFLREGELHFELIEQPLVVGALRTVEKFQRVLDVICFRAIGELHRVEGRVCIKAQPLRVPDVEIQPEVVLQIRVEGITILREHQHLRLFLVVEGVVSDVEGFAVHAAVFQIVHDVGLLEPDGIIFGGKSGQVALSAHDRAETHQKREQQRRDLCLDVWFRHVFCLLIPASL